MSLSSFFVCVRHVPVPLHVPLRHVQCNRHFSAGFDSCDFSSLCFRYQGWVVDEQALTFLEWTEEFEASVLFNRSEHSDLLLHDSRLDGNVSATVCFHIFLSECVQFSAVDDYLWPSMWVHRSVCSFKRQVPDHSITSGVPIRGLESMLASAWHVSTRQTPIGSRHKIVLHS